MSLISVALSVVIPVLCCISLPGRPDVSFVVRYLCCTCPRQGICSRNVSLSYPPCQLGRFLSAGKDGVNGWVTGALDGFGAYQGSFLDVGLRTYSVGPGVLDEDWAGFG
ncbi:hypothetical protein QAD02_010477 [Eretmocerus hayati]|uniref:Uncharacterized protein n=1 Tax=Eretmocerus hayati TaxID=131215 RepID=A0ACC2NU58_9HYME|nr:hypothetical protein QAD02_010477 [Eretmocerus hayati]